MQCDVGSLSSHPTKDRIIGHLHSAGPYLTGMSVDQFKIKRSFFIFKEDTPVESALFWFANDNFQRYRYPPSLNNVVQQFRDWP